MKKKEENERLRDMTVEELREEADRLKESLFRSRFKRALGESDAAKTISSDRKSLSRVMAQITIKQKEAQATTA
jgi:ribosomal protein L29